MNIQTEIKNVVELSGKTSANVVAIFAHFKTLANVKAAFIKTSKEWPMNADGTPVGEKAARTTDSGKKWNSFVVIAGRYIDLKLGRELTEQEKTDKKAAAKAAKEKALDETKKEQAGILKAAQNAVLTVPNCLLVLKKAASGNSAALAALVAFEMEMDKAAKEKATATKTTPKKAAKIDNRHLNRVAA
jgi:hypothetical protein